MAESVSLDSAFHQIVSSACFLIMAFCLDYYRIQNFVPKKCVVLPVGSVGASQPTAERSPSETRVLKK